MSKIDAQAPAQTLVVITVSFVCLCVEYVCMRVVYYYIPILDSHSLVPVCSNLVVLPLGNISIIMGSLSGL